MPYSYPIEEPASKHDVEYPQSLSPEDSLQHATELHLSTTSSFFHALQEPPANVKPFAFVYSYNDAPKERLSRKLSIVGFADLSMPVVRRLVSDDEDVVPDCLHRSTLGVRRGDKDHMKRLEPKHKKNSSSFAQFMQQLRKDNMVAILAKDKLERFGMIKPIDPIGSDEYNKEDFFCSCFVGNISEVKRYLMGDLASSSSKSSAKTKSEESSGVPMWQPSSPQDSGDLWQPPTSGNDSSNAGGLWQPPDAEGTDGGGDAFSWQPPDSGNAYSYDNNNPSGSGWDNSETTGNQDLKRKRESEEDEEEEFHADTGAAAADAFYSGLTRNLDTRADSQLYHMRAFNGWVKATQIQELDPKTKGSGKKMGGPLRILDLACGKGGDLGKWILHSRGIKDYVGSDVARGSLKDAAIRARRMRHRGLKQCTFTCADLGHDVPGRLRSPKQKLMQKLLTWSLQGEPEHTSAPPEFKMERGGGINPNQMFDVVSIQFAIHYMMSSQKRARRFFHTVSQLLEVGGNLIATTIDARVVIGHLMNLGADLHFHDNDNLNGREPLEIKVGGGACRIRFEPEIVAKIFKSKPQSNGISEDLFGLEYTFTLVEGADHGAGVGDAVNLVRF